MRTTLRHDLPCTPEQFWEVFFDQDLNEQMYREALGCTEVVYEHQSGDLDSGVRRSLLSTQPMKVPKAAKKVMGDAQTTLEEGTFEDGTWTFTMAPQGLPDKVQGKVQMSGSTRVEATDAGCVRVFEIEGSVKIPVLGKVIEGVVDKQSTDAQNATAEWLRAHFS